jgi:predicted ATPase
MIRRIQIDNFKSLDGFSLPPVGSPPLANFTCLIGANGSGKTTVLQAIDYLAHLIDSDASQWIKDRGWSRPELRSKHLNQRIPGIRTSFFVELEIDGIGTVKWHGRFVFNGPGTIEEFIEVNEKKVLEVKRGRLQINDEEKGSGIDLGALRFNGSSLRFLDEESLPISLVRFKSAMQNIKSLELLSPTAMRTSSRDSESIGTSGELLAGFLYKLKPEILNTVQAKAREFFPSFVQLITRSKGYGWRSLEAREKNVSLVTAKHLSDGFLRVLAIISQVEQENNSDAVILIDEIENGIHPELLEHLVVYLLQANPQIIVTTHSPQTLNYLSNEEARDSMIFLYRNSEGITRSCRYFDLPSASKKLGILGPGEVYIDTSIDRLAMEAEEIEQRTKAEAGAVAQ